MSGRHHDLRLRMEMLRLRGALQRADAEAALHDLRAGSRGILDLAGAVFRAGNASRSGFGWASTAITVLRERPLLLGLAMFALRVARRHPVATVIGAVVAMAARRALWPAASESPSADLGPD